MVFNSRFVPVFILQTTNISGIIICLFCLCSKYFCLCSKYFCLCSKYFCLCSKYFCLCSKYFCLCSKYFCLCSKYFCLCSKYFCLCSKYFCLTIKYFCLCPKYYCLTIKYFPSYRLNTLVDTAQNKSFHELTCSMNYTIYLRLTISLTYVTQCTACIIILLLYGLN